MLTDLDEVFRQGTAKAEENLKFRRYLAEHHHAEKPFQILASEVEKQVDCQACANCCKHSVVSVTKVELQVIADHLGTTLESVTELYTNRDPDAPALRLLKNSDSCVFLSDNLCMIYEARPEACRSFPHLGVGSHSLGGRPASLARWAALCPIIYNSLEAYKHAVGFKTEE